MLFFIILYISTLFLKLFKPNNGYKSIMKCYHYLPKQFRFFDVSLRDGLQTWKRIPTTQEKKTILRNIVNNTYTQKIEVGSIVSKKVLPQFEDTVELYHHCRKAYPNIIPFVLIPSLKMQQIALDYKIHHMSFISSVSESFQKKNTKMSLFETKKQLAFLIENCPGISKLYISCVNECPISGIMENKDIAKELMEYLVTPVDEICISDTCGTLTKERFEPIMKELRPFMEKENIPMSKLSLHLHKHVVPGETQKLITYCIQNGIYNFDVSCVEGGGCSVTMNENKINGNVSYDDFNF